MRSLTYLLNYHGGAWAVGGFPFRGGHHKPALVAVLLGLLLVVGVGGSAAQSPTPIICPDEPITSRHLANLSSVWVERCAPCLAGLTPTPQFPTVVPTATRTPSPTITPTITPTRTPTAGPTTTSTAAPVQMLSGAEIQPLTQNGYNAIVELGVYQLMPGHSIAPQFDYTWHTDSQGVTWDVVGYYFDVRQQDVTPNTRIVPYPLIPSDSHEYADLFTGDAASIGYISGGSSGNSQFGCFDVEIFAHSFDEHCNYLSGENHYFGGFLGNDQSFPECYEPSQEHCEGVYHESARLHQSLNGFSIGLAWERGAVAYEGGMETPTPIPAAAISVRLGIIVNYHFVGYVPPAEPPPPPSCAPPTFTGGMCAEHIVYFINNHPLESVFEYVSNEDSCYGGNHVGTVGGSAVSSGLSYNDGINGKFDGMGFQIDLGGAYSIGNITFTLNNWGNIPEYYRASIWVWDIAGAKWVKTAGGTGLEQYNEELISYWLGSTSHIYIATSAKTANGQASATHDLPFASLTVNFTGIGTISLSPNTPICQQSTPTPTVAPTASGTAAPTATPTTLATFTRTPTRTPTPSATSADRGYCSEYDYRINPSATPFMTSTATFSLNATETRIAQTGTPNATGTAILATAQSYATQTQSALPPTAQTATQSAAQTATPQAAITQTAIATCGRECAEVATFTAFATSQNISDVPSDYTQGEGGTETYVTDMFEFAFGGFSGQKTCYTIIPSFVGDSVSWLGVDVPAVKVCFEWLDIPRFKILGVVLPIRDLFAFMLLIATWRVLRYS